MSMLLPPYAVVTLLFLLLIICPHIDHVAAVTSNNMIMLLVMLHVLLLLFIMLTSTVIHTSHSSFAHQYVIWLSAHHHPYGCPHITTNPYCCTSYCLHITITATTCCLLFSHAAACCCYCVVRTAVVLNYFLYVDAAVDVVMFNTHNTCCYLLLLQPYCNCSH